LNKDLWLIKFAPGGELEWQKNMGGPYDDEANSVQQTLDGGYIVVVTVGLPTKGKQTIYGNRDCWVLKFGPGGDLEWEKSFIGRRRGPMSRFHEAQVL
jgi:hypothetical protein